MSRFQAISVPDPNGVPATGDVSLTQTSFIPPANNGNLDSLIHGLQTAVGIAIDKKETKVEANIKLRDDQLKAYNDSAKERLFASQQKYNEANIEYNQAVATGDEAAISEANGLLLDAMKEVGFETSRVADDNNIDLSIRQNAEAFSTQMYNLHSEKIEKINKAEEAERKAAEFREINKAVQSGIAALNEPYVMDTIIRQQQAQEGPPLPADLRFQSFVDLTTQRFADQISSATGLQGEDLQEYLESEPVQKAILDNSSRLNNTFLNRQLALAKEDEKLQRKALINSSTETLVSLDRPATTADIGYIVEISGANENEIKFELAQDLSARYGRANIFTAFNDTEGWMNAIASADNLSISDLKSELSNSFVGVVQELKRTSLQDYYNLRLQVQKLYPDLDNMPSYLSEIKSALQLNDDEPVSLRTAMPGGDIRDVNYGFIADKNIRNILGIAQDSQREYFATTGINMALNSDGSYVPFFNEETGQVTEQGLVYRKRYVESQASFWLMARSGIESEVDTVSALNNSLHNPESIEELGVAIDVLRTSNKMRSALLGTAETTADRLYYQMVLDSDILADPNSVTVSGVLDPIRRRAMIAARDPGLTKDTWNRAIKETQQFFDEVRQVNTLTPADESAIMYEYSKLRSSGVVDPDKAFDEAVKIFRSTHWPIDGQWVPFTMHGLPQNPADAINNISYNMMENLYTERRTVLGRSAMMGSYTQTYERLNGDDVIGVVSPWLPQIQGDYEYQTLMDAVKNTVKIGGYVDTLKSLRQPFNILSGNYTMVNDRMVPDKEIAKAVLANRISQDSKITQQLLDRFDGPADVSAIRDVQWFIASALMGESTSLAQSGISVMPAAYTQGADGRIYLSLDIYRASSTVPFTVTISPDLYQEISTERLMAPAKETTEDRRSDRELLNRRLP